jgi:hypothetical protein
VACIIPTLLSQACLRRHIFNTLNININTNTNTNTNINTLNTLNILGLLLYSIIQTHLTNLKVHSSQ